mgnify:FL=1
MDRQNIKLEPSWLDVLRGEFDQPYMVKLKQFLVDQKSAGKTIYPMGTHWFSAFNRLSFSF